MNYGLRNCSLFPLTLTLSHQEREQLTPPFGFSKPRLANAAVRFAVRLRTILPLAKGEGWGEWRYNAVYGRNPRPAFPI